MVYVKGVGHIRRDGSVAEGPVREHRDSPKRLPERQRLAIAARLAAEKCESVWALGNAALYRRLARELDPAGEALTLLGDDDREKRYRSIDAAMRAADESV